MSDKARVNMTVKVRAGVTVRSGTSKKGNAYTLSTVEVLDEDDNKLELVLPREGCPALTVGETYSVTADAGEYGGRLQLDVRSIRPANVNANGELKTPLAAVANK